MEKKKNIKKILEENWEEIAQLASSGVEISKLSSYFNIPVNAINAKLKKENQPSTTPIKGKQGKKLNILILDIENAPMMSYHWGLYNQNVNPAMRIEENRSYMMCFAAKWLGEDKIFYHETRTEDDSKVVSEAMKLIDQADYVIGHNMKKFDLPKINAYAALNGYDAVSPVKIIDTLAIARRHFSFEKNTLAYLTEALKCDRTKQTHKEFNGFELWSECIKGNKKAWKEMRIYNEYDVLSLEDLYIKLRPYIKGHPSVVIGTNSGQKRCPTCGSYNVKPNGYSYTNVSKFSQYKCSDCGSFSRNRKNELTKVEKDNLLVPVTGF